MSYTEVRNSSDLNRALACARGCYQRALLNGSEAWSGATLKGKAKSYGAHYARSRKNLMARVKKAGVPCYFTNMAHNKKVLVLGVENTRFERV